MSTLLSLAASRFSCRSFSPQEVEPAKLNQILQAGRLAPTALNHQPQRIYIIQGAEPIARAAQCTPCLYGAQTAILMCYDSDLVHPIEGNQVQLGFCDASIVLTHMMLMAEEMGLATCWVARFDEARTRELFQLPANLVPVAFMPIGYLASDALPSERHNSRLPLSQTVRYVK